MPTRNTKKKSWIPHPSHFETDTQSAEFLGLLNSLSTLENEPNRAEVARKTKSETMRQKKPGTKQQHGA